MVTLLTFTLLLAAAPALPAPQPAASLPALVSDHPAAKACAAQPDKCTCAVSRPVACIDTPAGKAKLATCVRNLLRQYGGRVRMTPAALNKAVHDRCRDSLGWEECGPPRCIRWAGVNEDFGSESARNPWILWQVLERAADKPENVRTVCTFEGGPGSSPCRINTRTPPEQLARHLYVPISVGHWRAPRSLESAPRATYGENPLGQRPPRSGDGHGYGEDDDEDGEGEWSRRDSGTGPSFQREKPLVERIVHARNFYVKVGRFLERTDKGWADGTYALVPVQDTSGSRATGAWTFFHPHGAPRMRGTLQPAGVLKQEFRTGKWTFYDVTGRPSQDGEYQVVRDPQEDRFFTAQMGLWRNFVQGKLRAVEYFREPSPLKYDWKTGDKPVSRTFGRFQAMARLDLDAEEQPTHFSEQVFHQAYGRWLRHGAQVRWAGRQVASVENHTFDQLTGPSFRYAAQGAADLPWPAGTVETRYDAFALSTRYVSTFTSPDSSVRQAAEAVGKERSHHAVLDEGWALSADVASDLGLSINFSIAKADFGRLATECAYRVPRRNTSQRYCQSDADCVGQGSCDTVHNTCAPTWPEGWRQDQLVPYCQENWSRTPTDFANHFYRAVRVTRRFGADREPKLTTCLTRWSGSDPNRSEDAPPGERVQLIWARTTPGYERPEAAEDQVQLTPSSESWENRACFNLPAVPLESAEAALRGIPKRMRGKGLDAWLPPIDEAAEAAAAAATPPADTGRPAPAEAAAEESGEPPEGDEAPGEDAPGGGSEDSPEPEP